MITEQEPCVVVLHLTDQLLGVTTQNGGGNPRYGRNSHF
jgi:hypothetical protein